MNRICAIALLVLAAGCAKEAVKAEAPVAPQPAPAAEETHTNVQPLLDTDEGATKAFDHRPQPGEKALCAVSGEPFTITADTKVAEHEGRWYAFCCDECAPEFAADPAKYAGE